MMNFDNVAVLGETTGGVIKDFSQYGNNGSGYGGVTWTGNGKWSGGYSFDGINDSISILDNINNRPGTGDLTIALRVWAPNINQVAGLI